MIPTHGLDDFAERDASDRRALARIGAGDVEAVAVLYDRYAGAAMNLAQCLVASRADAEEVVVDAFLAVVEAAPRFDPARGSVAGWLVTRVRDLSVERTLGQVESASRAASPPPR